VVISSLAGKLPVPGRAAYAASKHALHGFFDALRGELYQYGIAVTIVCPGFVHTKISENALMPDGSRRGGAADREHRKAMTPAESARHILYAIRTRKQEYHYGGPEKYVVPARALFPWLYARAMRKVRLSG
jgi:short-subunit dehydrogenase